VCGVEHSDELHGAVERVRQWQRNQIEWTQAPIKRGKRESSGGWPRVAASEVNAAPAASKGRRSLFNVDCAETHLQAVLGGHASSRLRRRAARARTSA
jgi:hypothetical protein